MSDVSEHAKALSALGAAKGGKARAKKLSPEQLSASGKKAADARWGGVVVATASHDGPLKVGDAELFAAVLPDGRRLLSQGTFLKAIGRSRTPKAGAGGFATVDGKPFFLQAEALNPFISQELLASTSPVFFRDTQGRRTIGYDAQLLPMVAEVYLRYRDALVKEKKEVPTQYKHIVNACDLLMRGLARVGIIALVDEATGYQYDRARTALAEILEEFISKELVKWVKTFPDEFYAQLFRLKKCPANTLAGSKRPLWVGKITLNLIYQRLAPGVREELQRLTPRDSRGRLKHKLHQRLSEDVGHPKLQEHFLKLLTLMRAVDDWDTFYKLANKALPKYKDMPLLTQQIEEEDAAELTRS